MEKSQTTRHKEKPRKTTREVIKKYFEINDLIEAWSWIKHYGTT